jgi:hypothetical protein
MMEASETFLVQLFLPINATLDDSQAIGTILGASMLTPSAASTDLPRLKIAAAGAGRLQLSFASTTGRTYVLEASETPENSERWQQVSDVAPLAGTGGTLTIELSIQPGPSHRFYRVRLVE